MNALKLPGWSRFVQNRKILLPSGLPADRFPNAGDRAGILYSWDLNQSPWQKAGQRVTPIGYKPETLADYRDGSIFGICARNDSSTIYFSGVAGKIFSFKLATRAIKKVVDLGKTVFSLVCDEANDCLYAACADGKIRMR